MSVMKSRRLIGSPRARTSPGGRVLDRTWTSVAPPATARRHTSTASRPLRSASSVSTIKRTQDSSVMTKILRGLRGATTATANTSEAILEATGHVSMQLEQAVHLLEALASRQDVTEAQVARIDERTKKLTPAHEREVQAWVERIVRETEKRSPQSPLAYASLYGRIKTRFRVGSYKEIPDERFDQLIIYLREELKKVTGGELPEQGSLF